jgi:chemotaxis protein MotB
MDEKHPEIIIIKRHSSHEEEHHGGAWKIAFADFMTAMMAFFLVLWIINATTKDTKTIIARYFNPLKLEELAKAKKGIRPAESDSPATPNPQEEDAPQKAGGPAKDANPADKKEPAAKLSTGATDKEPVDPAHPKAQLAENTLFKDPYASLDQIAGKVAPQPPMKAGNLTGGEMVAPPKADLDAFVDPFKPLARGESAEIAAEEKSEPPAAPVPPPVVEPTTSGANAKAAAVPALTPAAGPEAATPPAPAAPPPAAAESEKATIGEATKLQSEIAKELNAETHAQPAPEIDVQATAEGTLISLTDNYSFGMFATGSAEPQPKVVRIMEKIAKILKTTPGAIVVRGHTDARPYRSANYDNWRLSSARAQMAYYMLTRGGLDEKRIQRIEGYADRMLKTPDKPDAAENRRIEILIKKDKS